MKRSSPVKSKTPPRQAGSVTGADDMLDQELRDSFPASDPPSITQYRAAPSRDPGESPPVETPRDLRGKR